MSLRQRRPAGEVELTPTSKPGMGTRLVRSLKKLDAYPKLNEDFAVRTSTGGKVTLLTCIICLLLFASEWSEYVRVRRTEHVSVDATISEAMPISFNISFPRIRCGQAMVDVMDVAGEQQVNVGRNTYKQRLDGETGAAIGDPYLDHHKVDPHAHLKRMHGVRVQHAHEDDDSAEQQHVGEHGEQEVTEDPSQEGEGCRLFGTLVVSKVAGNFHIALGASHRSGGKHVHHFMLSEALHFDTSHRIHSLSFGGWSPEGHRNPLDGVERMLDSGTGHFQYFLQIVPTTHRTLEGNEIRTMQYSVNEQVKRVNFRKRNGVAKIPGVFFVYDISPFHVKVSESREPLTEFLVSICAIIGGAVTVAGLVDSIIEHSGKVKRRVTERVLGGQPGLAVGEDDASGD